MPAIKRRTFHTYVASGFLGGPALSVFGQVASPSVRPVRIIVAFPAGGGADLLARSLGQKLAAVVGQPVIVENRVGVSGLLGSEFVAKSMADGTTLLMASTTQAIASKLYPKAPVDFGRDLAPVAFVGKAPLVLVVHPGVPAHSLPDLLNLARIRRVAYASAASGTVGHLSMEILKSMSKADLLHVPYRGTAPATNDLIGGHVDAMMDILPNALQYIRTSRLRPLAVTSAERLAELPHVPTVAEVGFTGYEALNWYGLLAPAGTPPEVVAQLHAGVTKTLADSEVASRLTAQGYAIAEMTSQAFGSFIDSDLRKWEKAIKDAGAKPE